jgi:hypothetical protein
VLIGSERAPGHGRGRARPSRTSRPTLRRGERLVVDRRLHLGQHLLRPGRELVARNVGARRNAEDALGGERLRFDRARKLEELERRGAVRRAASERDGVVDHRRARARKA